MTDLYDWSNDRELLNGSPLDVARWLLCSEGWLSDAAALDDYVATVEADALTAAAEKARADAAESRVAALIRAVERADALVFGTGRLTPGAWKDVRAALADLNRALP